MAQAPFGEHRRPLRKKWYVLGHLPPWKCCKVFCALVVTVKTCVLRMTTKEGRQLLASLNLPPPLKILRAPTAADGTSPKIAPVRLWQRLHKLQSWIRRWYELICAGNVSLYVCLMHSGVLYSPCQQCISEAEQSALWCARRDSLTVHVRTAAGSLSFRTLTNTTRRRRCGSPNSAAVYCIRSLRSDLFTEVLHFTTHMSD